MSGSPTTPPLAISPDRLHELDWLRVIAFGILTFFHCAMPFTSYPWHIKNADHSRIADQGIWFFHEFRTPLLFAIAGASAAFAIRLRTLLRFIAERTTRLLIPFLFGIAIIVPPQAYVKRLQTGRNPGSYIDFWLHAWSTGQYPMSGLPWHHLWFLAYLWVLSLALAPCYAVMRLSFFTNAIERLARSRSRWLLYAIPAIGLCLVEGFMRPQWVATNTLIGDWTSLAADTICLLTGFVIVSSPATLDYLARIRWFSLALLGISYAINVTAYTNADLAGEYRPLLRAIFRLTSGLDAWTGIAASLGLARAYLRKPHPWLPQANEAVYPFYIVHQTITVLAAYWIVAWPISISAKYITLVLATFLGTWLIYELIRRFTLTRLLFGMRPKPGDTRPMPAGHTTMPEANTAPTTAAASS